jgi:hypothetical protein
MKFLKLIAMVALFSSTALAGNGALLQYTYNPGFEPQPVKRQLTVQHDGQVVYDTQDFRGGKTTHALVAHLMPDRVKALETVVAKINAADLVDLDAGEALCTDTPTPVYSVQNSRGEEVVISRHASCHRYEMPNSVEAEQLKNLLTALTDLAQSK